MLGHTKGLPTNIKEFILITVDRKQFKIPNTVEIKKKLISFLEEAESAITPWDKAKPWEEIASDRIKRYTEVGLALRGARYREGLSQKQLAMLCGISQDNLSRMENGKRVIGEKTAKKLAKVLRIDYHLFLDG